MPILAGVFANFFGFIAGLLAKRLTIGFAAAGAFVATSATAFLVVKAAIAGIVAGLSAVAPPAVVAAAGYFMPGNVSVCVTAVLLADTVVVAYDYWRGTMGAAIALAKG
jgi:hypothetical protein